VRFMEGAPKKPWWAYTPERKKMLAEKESKGHVYGTVRTVWEDGGETRNLPD